MGCVHASTFPTWRSGSFQWRRARDKRPSQSPRLATRSSAGRPPPVFSAGICPHGRAQLGEQLKKTLLSLAAITLFTLSGCALSEEPSSADIPNATASPAASEPATPAVLGETALTAAGNPPDCEEDIFGSYDYMAYCPDSELLVLEVENPEDGGENGTEFATKNDWTGWWATSENWMILGTEEETARIAAANDAQHFHTPGMSSLTVGGLPYQWEDFADEAPEEQVYRLADELEDVTRATCDNVDFDFKHGAIAGGKCAKADYSGSYTIGIYPDEKELKKAMEFFSKTLGLLDQSYYTLVGETWLIMNVDESSADELQEKVGGVLKQLSS